MWGYCSHVGKKKKEKKKKEKVENATLDSTENAESKHTHSHI